MEVDPLFIGPAALAKAYRFVGDPRDAEHFERLTDLSEDEHGIYDCTHCFNCIDACPKDVAPMSQIMRLRRVAGNEYEINDRNNGHRHEKAFVSLVRDYGLLHEAELLPRSYGGDSWFAKFTPAAGKELASSLSTVIKGVVRGKISPKLALFGHKIAKPDREAVKEIYREAEAHHVQLNLYVVGREDDVASEPVAPAAAAPVAPAGGAGPADKSPTFPGPGEGSQPEQPPTESETS
jgi:succinate dehydrogenase / fumarate reductase iron-sulfur subunit